ncbi:MAG: polysaccharide deacetylase family protein [Eubacteriales bacterium]|nr:polysaccharide deacetylase family protein [Eubacteriales bacterium]
MEETSKKRGRPWLWVLIALLAIGVLAAAAWFVTFRVNHFSLELALTGDPKVLLEYGDSFTEPGVTPILRGTLFLKEGYTPEKLEILRETDLNEGKLGKYSIIYSAKLLNCSAAAQREVRVIDTKAPTITLKEDPEGSLVEGVIYQEAGFTATDNYDGDITDRVVRTEEPGLVTYAVTDSSGNPAVAKRQIPFRDMVLPEILLEGGEDYTITLGTRYEEPGFTATDNVDGDVTAMVQVEGEVDWLTAGTYPITYTVTDSCENQTVVTRNVEVVTQPWQDTVYPEGKVVYLTFDDGPSAYTAELLDVLDAYGAKATFFVVGSGNGSMMRQIVNRGHSIGIHSVSHNYDQIYASPEAYFDDLMNMQSIIYDNTGVKTTLMRFPGGSSNLVSRHSCEGIMTFLTQAVQDAGFQYFDWNVYSGDAGETKKTEKVADNVIEGIQQHRVSIVLQHDIHSYSVDAVEDILSWGKRNGYRFLALQPGSPGFHHDLNN